MITYNSIRDIIDHTYGLMHKHDETELLFELASRCPKGGNIVEIGSYCGLSSLCLAFGAKNSESNLYCFTEWQDKASITWRNNINKFNLKTTVIYGDANKILQDIHVKNINMVFLDADHKYVDLKCQYNSLFDNMNNNSIIAFHDYGRQYPEVKQFCDELIYNNQIINTNVIHCTLYGQITKYPLVYY